MIPKDSDLAKAGEAATLFLIGLTLLTALFIISGITILVIGKKLKRNNLIKIGKYILGGGILLLGITLFHYISWI